MITRKTEPVVPQTGSISPFHRPENLQGVEAHILSTPRRRTVIFVFSARSLVFQK